ncbi:MAG: ScbR family autoregulator-binding transcription factor [Gordonia sp. (in: high G+C Gram-positive bacteria)]|uniref:ScbR family autoregulator-binding transcription factor n=1 Tax=Gordonia sp. (in: high G+C Gram-positive bacteria) TaxID=84139 RepID=UPI0039E5F68F
MAKQARAVVTYEQILRGAAQAFGEAGYERAKLNDIVEATGVTRGALYFHFESKEALSAAVIERQHELSMRTVAAIAESGAPALAQIVMLCHEMGRQIVTDPIVHAGIRLTLELNAAQGPKSPYEDWIEVCRALAERAIEEGDLLSTVSAAELGDFVISSFTGVQMVANVLTGRSDLEQRVDRMWGLLLPAVMRPDSTHPLDEIRRARWTSPDDPATPVPSNTPIPAAGPTDSAD